MRSVSRQSPKLSSFSVERGSFKEIKSELLYVLTRRNSTDDWDQKHITTPYASAGITVSLSHMIGHVTSVS